MRKGLIVGAILLGCVILLGGIAYAGLDIEGEFTLDLDTEELGGYSQMAYSFNPEPFGFTLTWKRDWVPVTGNSLIGNAGITLGIFGLQYERELLEPDTGTATATLTMTPLTIEYVRELDGIDLGALTVSYAWGVFTLGYERLFNEDAIGTVSVAFKKSL